MTYFSWLRFLDALQKCWGLLGFTLFVRNLSTLIFGFWQPRSPRALSRVAEGLLAVVYIGLSEARVDTYLGCDFSPSRSVGEEVLCEIFAAFLISLT